MTSPRRFEQDLPALLADLYLAGTPDYRDDLTQRIAGTRQRPAWTLAERWIPMDVTTTRVPSTRLPWRQLGVLALLLILIAGAVAVYVGAQQQTRLPAPFGLAANGNVAYARGGDIFVADPVTGAETAIVTGPEHDGRAVWSPDGTKIAFKRGSGGLFVVGADGQGLKQVTQEPLQGLESWSFSPDGRFITALVGHGDPSIMVVTSDGSGEPRIFDVPATRNDSPPQYSPDGTEIMYIGAGPGAESRAIFALDPATGETRSVISAPASRDISGALWSPDGSKISYNMHDTTADGFSNRTYIASADGSGAVAVDTDPDTLGDFVGLWSNDGTRVIIGRIYPERATIAIVPVDRSNAGVELECPPGAPVDDCMADWIWSPDDTMLIGARGADGDQFLADPQTGKIRPAPWSATGVPVMQRRAP